MKEDIPPGVFEMRAVGWVMLVLSVCAAILDPHLWWAAAFFGAVCAWNVWGRRSGLNPVLRLKELMPAPAVMPATVCATAVGLYSLREPERLLRWDEVVEVSLSAELNPWSDFGAYNNVSWVVRTASRRLRINQTPADNEVLHSAFALHLPGWCFSLDLKMLGTLIAPENGGIHLCWKRAGSGPSEAET